MVSQRYHTVQPREVLEFYRDLTEVSGYELETAGGKRKAAAAWRWREPDRALHSRVKTR